MLAIFRSSCQFTASGHTFYSFGESVSISGDGATIAVGTPTHEMDSVVHGSAFVFLRPATGWINAGENQWVTGNVRSYFGHSVALSDDATTLVVGAPGKYSTDLPGEAQVFTRRSNPGAPDSYLLVAGLAPSDGHVMDLFGYAASIDGTGGTIVVGSPDHRTTGNVGGAYVYVRPINGWGTPNYTMTENAKLTASDAAINGGTLGIAVDISVDGNTIVAGMEGKSEGAPGPFAAYFFGKGAAGWSTSTESTKVIPFDYQMTDQFGSTTSLSGNGNVAVVGAYGKTIDANVGEGAAYVFTGNTIAPRASVSPASLTFGLQTAGTTSTAKTVTLTNSGSAPLHVTGVGTVGPFTTTQNCVSASPLAIGGNCSENVVFAPLSGGPTAGALTFTDDGGGTSGATQQVQLQGTGQKANSVTTITVSANRVVVGQSVRVSFTVTPEPGSTVTPFGPVIVQASTGESCGGAAQSNMQYSDLTFTTAQNRTITATYNGSASLNPSTSSSVTVPVFDFGLSVSPSSQTVGGKKASFGLTVNAANGSGAMIALKCSGGPPNGTCAVSPASVTLSSPTTAAKATVSFPNNTASGTYQLTFTARFGTVVRTATAGVTVK